MNLSNVVKEHPTVEVKELILEELESTRNIECPYSQCDEMYHAWHEAFDKMKEVVNKVFAKL